MYSDSVALDKTLIGEVEFIHLIKPAIRLAARVDTGATTSSLGVVEQQTYERDGQKWVRFIVSQPGTEQLIELRQPIVRMATVKGAASMKDRRIVVALDVRLGDVVEKTEFNLADRRHFQYPVLIGRNLLRGEFVVDVGQQYLLSSGGEQE